MALAVWTRPGRPTDAAVSLAISLSTSPGCMSLRLECTLSRDIIFYLNSSTFSAFFDSVVVFWQKRSFKKCLVKVMRMPAPEVSAPVWWRPPSCAFSALVVSLYRSIFLGNFPSQTVGISEVCFEMTCQRGPCSCPI
jgi:hypothetical protein